MLLDNLREKQKNKSFKQIKDLPNSFVVADDIEMGSGNKIPLWVFVLKMIKGYLAQKEGISGRSVAYELRHESNSP